MKWNNQHSKDWLNWAGEFHLSSPEVSDTRLFLSQALQLSADQVRVSQVRGLGVFLLVLHDHQGRVCGLLTPLITNLIIIPPPMFMLMTWLVWIMTWLVHYMPTQLERTNKVDMLGVTIIQVTNSFHLCWYRIFIKYWKYLRMYKISSSWATRVPHCHNCLRFNFMLQFVACCHQSASAPTETQLLNQLSMLSVHLTHLS